MPNIIRRPRSRQPGRRRNRACDPGTHLTYEERHRIYHLLQHLGYSQREIASTLQLPRTTVQSAIYAMFGRCRKQQKRMQELITLAPNSAPDAICSSGTVCTPSVSNTGKQAQTVVQQLSLRHFTNATMPVQPIATSTTDGYHGQPSQPAVAAYSWDNPQLNRLSMECFELQQFSAQEGSIRSLLLPPPPKLLPMEPRVIYESSNIAHSRYQFRYARLIPWTGPSERSKAFAM